LTVRSDPNAAREAARLNRELGDPTAIV